MKKSKIKIFANKVINQLHHMLQDDIEFRITPKDHKINDSIYYAVSWIDLGTADFSFNISFYENHFNIDLELNSNHIINEHIKYGDYKSEHLKHFNLVFDKLYNSVLECTNFSITEIKGNNKVELLLNETLNE